jgi:hypothetical protein
LIKKRKNSNFSKMACEFLKKRRKLISKLIQALISIFFMVTSILKTYMGHRKVLRKGVISYYSFLEKNTDLYPKLSTGYIIRYDTNKTTLDENKCTLFSYGEYEKIKNFLEKSDWASRLYWLSFILLLLIELNSILPIDVVTGIKDCTPKAFKESCKKKREEKEDKEWSMIMW